MTGQGIIFLQNLDSAQQCSRQHNNLSDDSLRRFTQRHKLKRPRMGFECHEFQPWNILILTWRNVAENFSSTWGFFFSSNIPKLKNPSKAPSILINAYVANQRTRWSWRELHHKFRPCFEKLEWRKAWLVRPRSARKREICFLQASAFNDYTIEGMV